ncbi:hypothetical protein V8C42DRAFT_360580 [Trichoderma barbatum]
MVSAYTSVKTLPVLAAGAFDAASYPPIPADLTTPVQQRIAVNGPNTTTYYYEIVSTNSSVDHFLSHRLAGDKTPFSINAIIDLGVVGPDGYTIKNDQTKRDTIPSIDPSLNHTTIQRLAQTVNDYEFVIHPGDLAYADDWIEKPKNILTERMHTKQFLSNFMLS